MATIDEDLNQLEKDVRQLKIEYEQYFGGGRSRPPTDLEWRIELVIKRYGERGSNMRFAHRYRYAGLAQTYARYKEVFRKRLRQKEEGVVVRHFGAAAKAIESERAKKRDAEPPMESSGAAAHAKSRKQTSTAGGDAGALKSSPDLNEQDAKANKLYEAFRDAKKKAGESTRELTPDAFQAFLKHKTEELAGKSGGKKVIFAISTEGGKVRLKARVSDSGKTES